MPSLVCPAKTAPRSTQLGNPAVSMLIACKDIITVKEVQSVRREILEMVHL
jgi:hypothetical protein